LIWNISFVQNASIQQFITDSNKRIEGNLSEIKKLENMMKYGDMTMEDFKDVHPELAFDPNRPSIFPHTPEFQPDEEPEQKAAAH
jgi:hypothetical protein